MSFIMKALKRADEERDAIRVAAPRETPGAARSRWPWWAITVVVLLALNVVVLGFVLLPEVTRGPVSVTRTETETRGARPPGDRRAAATEHATPPTERRASTSERRAVTPERRRTPDERPGIAVEAPRSVASAPPAPSSTVALPRAASPPASRSVPGVETRAPDAAKPPAPVAAAPARGAARSAPPPAAASPAPAVSSGADASVPMTSNPASNIVKSPAPGGRTPAPRSSTTSHAPAPAAEPTPPAGVPGTLTEREAPSAQTEGGNVPSLPPRTPAAGASPSTSDASTTTSAPAAPGSIAEPSGTAPRAPAPSAATPRVPPPSAAAPRIDAPAPTGAVTPPPSPPAPPALRLDVLVYADAPAGRMAFINGRKYVQGQSVEGGFVVDRITEDGVVLSQQGQIFLLTPPRR